MRVGINEACFRHDPGRAHPDRRGRLEILRDALAERPSVELVEPAAASRAEVERVHDPDYLDRLLAFIDGGGGAWDPDTVASAATWEAALGAAGLATWASHRALETVPGAATPFALARPPGHHAMYDDAMGFCFVNNVAVGAASLLAETSAERVGILDWDVHHANGTEQFVIETPGTALVSVHERGLYPGTGTFRGETHERALNVPLPTDLGDGAYLHVFEATAVAAMRRFDPDVVLVSCGFDAVASDVLASQQLTPDGYGLLTDAVCRLGRELDCGVGFVLEGGYAIDALAPCAAALADAVAGDVPARPAYEPETELEDVVDRARAHPLIDA